MAGEERTRQVFGDYVSIYNFKQSVDDHATVPLYYENRIPELQLTNQTSTRIWKRLLEKPSWTKPRRDRLEREFCREYHLITRDDRLEKIAEDIVLHFMGRGFQGKAMVVSIDKATAVRMYDKVQKLLEDAAGVRCKPSWKTCDARANRPELEAKVDYHAADRHGGGRLAGPERDRRHAGQRGWISCRTASAWSRKTWIPNSKTRTTPSGIVFVCAMWMTGFDVPSCSTIYLDKPMRNHTLMQTIARANRVFGEKVNGLIVDYIGVFRDLQRAPGHLRLGAGGSAGEGEMPVEAKRPWSMSCAQAIQRRAGFPGRAQCRPSDADPSRRWTSAVVRLLEDAVDACWSNDEIKREYLSLAGPVDRLFHAILPDPAANEFGPDRKAIVVIAEKILQR